MNTKILLLISLSTAASVSCIAPKLHAQVRSAKVLAEYSLAPFSLANFGYSDADIATAQANGLTRTDLPAIGSGLQQLVGNQFVGVSDRGPTFTRTTPTAGRVFPLPSYTPCLVFFRLEAGQILPQSFLPVSIDDVGTPATGISNSATEDSVPFASPTAPTQLPFNPNGLDVEDLHALPGGNWIVVDEYSPSVAILGATGKVLKRYTPQGKILLGTAYPVSDNLPAILAQRRSNRGFECVAVSNDGRTAYTMTQSPLGPTGATAPTRMSRIVRVLRLDINDPLNLQVTGQFLLRMSLASSYPAGNRPQDLKVSSAAWVSENKLLLLERSDEPGIGGAKLILADLAGATDVSDMIEAQTLALENSSLDLASLNITPATSTVVYANEETPEITDFKLEGLSILTPNDVAISNDNDFGIGDNITGTPSRVWLIRLRDQLPMIPMPNP
jgi:hypothetical protein